MVADGDECGKRIICLRFGSHDDNLLGSMETKELIKNIESELNCKLYIRCGTVYSVNDRLESMVAPDEHQSESIKFYLQFIQDSEQTWNYRGIVPNNPFVMASMSCHQKNDWSNYEDLVERFRHRISNRNLLTHESLMMERSLDLIADIFEKCESVLEKTFLAYFLYNYGYKFNDFYHKGLSCEKFSLNQQVKIDAYRVDFVLKKLPRGKKIIIELDGHEFHSGRKELTRYKSRDRKLQKSGYQIFRFTYEEMYGNPKKHIETLFEYINDGK